MELIKREGIDELLMTRVQYLHYLKESYKIIMDQILRKKSKYEFNKELVDYYMEKFNEVNNEFKFLSVEIITDINEEYLKDEYYSEYNFDDKEVLIYKK